MAVTTTDAKNKGLLCHGCGKRVNVVVMGNEGKRYCVACDPYKDRTVIEVTGTESEKVT